MKKLYVIIFLLLCVSQTSFGQLSNFTLTVTGTDEFCTGNGSLSFSVANTTPGSTIIYRIYKLPDTVNSIAVTSANTFGGLTSGTYRVIATQTLGSDSGTQQQEITLNDSRNIVTFEVTNDQVNCDTGNIIVNVLTGVPATYEIISGPVLFPPQASNTFPNLHAGVYDIRVIDECGEGVVQTYTLTFANPPNLSIGDFSTTCALTSCDSININSLLISNNGNGIRYPLSVEITVFPPSNGTPIVVNQTIASGDPHLGNLSQVIPFYYNQAYTFTIRIVDACGNVYIKDNNRVFLRMTAGADDAYSHCLNGFKVYACNLLPPFTITFLTAPAGFNPQNFNSGHPGPFMDGTQYYTSTSLANQMPLGLYQVQFTDSCGHVVTTQITLREHEPGYAIVVPPNQCNQFLQIPENPPVGPLIVSAVFTSATTDMGHPIPYDVTGNIVDGVLYMPIQPGTYTVEGVDECGDPYRYTIIVPPLQFSVTLRTTDVFGCRPGGVGGVNVDADGLSRIASILITQAPVAFNQPLPYTAYTPVPPETSVTAVNIINLPPGDYTIQITDICGIVIFENFRINTIVSNAPLNLHEKRGCGEGIDSIALDSPNGGLVTVIITAAPPAFPHNLPYDVSFNISSSDAIFYMNSFPEGSYTFYSKDICNVERTDTFNLSGYHNGGNIDVLDSCGSFTVNMNFSDTTIDQNTTFWLQKYDPLTGRWTHPMTGVNYPNNTIPTTTNSYPLNNLAFNYNIVATGTFRVVSIFNYYFNGSPALNVCLEVVKTFEYTGVLKIVSAYAIPCINGGSQVFIITNGTPPLDYNITTRDGAPFAVHNGTSNSFSSLQPGIYNFRVEDACGNIVNRLLDITTLQQPEIASSNLCVGLNGQLSVQPFSFLNYEWTKGSDPTILSTTNTLTFTPYTNANAGVYHVRIFSTTTNSCVDRVLNYTIAPNTLPNAGLDGTRSICGSSPSINLFTVLNGTYDVGGTWQETTSSGMLIGSNWMPTGLPVGTYIFNYRVNGFCGAFDDSIVTITLNPDVALPVITVDPSYCPGENIAFSIQTIPNATYAWTGPNNFTSTLQNPTIESATAVNAGTYTVTATIGQCQSESEVIIVSNPAPDYTYESGCEAGAFTVRIVPTSQSSFDPGTATYLWTGPNNFTSTANPLILTNQPAGTYSVVVTSNQGCFVPQDIIIANTFCDFPNVITPGHDGFNDSFDLTNYDVELLQVFSRWGRLVYEESNYTNGWYGQNMCGGYLPDSTYYYFVKLRNGQEKHGWIFVGRG